MMVHPELIALQFRFSVWSPEQLAARVGGP
jgi:hypothetical protein